MTYINPAAVRTTRLKREEIEGRRLWDLFPGLERSDFGPFFKRVAMQRRLESLEHYDKAVGRWYFYWAYPFEDGTAVVFMDVTSQVDARKRIEQAARARDEFMSIASHELKTPLSGLMLQAQGIQRALVRGDESALTEERVSRVAEQTGKQAARLARLVDDMLDAAQLNSGAFSIFRKLTDLTKLIQDVVERFRPQFDAQQTPLEVEPSPSAVVSIDRDRIEQVLSNLLTNALLYGRGKRVTVKLALLDEAVRVSVTDLGDGIAEQHHRRVFERYERAISANEVSGLGLGLFIARQIVQGHGGRIWVDSEVGHGATFSFELQRP